MHYISTRLNSPKLSFLDVVIEGLANDGGLYVPEFIPVFDESKLKQMQNLEYSELFFEVTKNFIGNEIPEDIYREIIKKSYQNFSNQALAPLKQISNQEFLLELFHGPTLAFKDFALQFLGNLLDYLLKKSNQKIAIIGATSGDTGSAAINGCMKCENAKIFILHPHQKVSEIQRRQMTTIIADNVFNIAVEGNFDDCQALVKKMFVNQSFLKGTKMVAVNSINFARIMAQIVYYFYSAFRLGISKDRPLSFVVPTGNFGDIYAGFLAKRMGLNINKLVIATNGNDILNRFIKNNDYSRKNLIETISPSMNIQVSSNFERLLFDFYKKNKRAEELALLMANFERTGSLKVDAKILQDILNDFDSYSCNDEETKQQILKSFDKNQEVLDPHTAIGVSVSSSFMASKNYHNEPVIILGTAHPAKFSQTVIEAGIKKVRLPHFINDLYQKNEKMEILTNDFNVITKFIGNNV